MVPSMRKLRQKNESQWSYANIFHDTCDARDLGQSHPCAWAKNRQFEQPGNSRSWKVIPSFDYVRMTKFTKLGWSQVCIKSGSKGSALLLINYNAISPAWIYFLCLCEGVEVFGFTCGCRNFQLHNWFLSQARYKNSHITPLRYTSEASYFR